MPLPELLAAIKTAAGKKKVYIVGGWLRDRALKWPNRDLDIAVEGNPIGLARKIARTFRASFVRLDEVNKVFRVVLRHDPDLDYIDFAQLKAKDILSDLKRRDFTINALAVEIEAPGKTDLSKVIDPLSGSADLKKRVVRMTAPGVFRDDPLRLLRAFRFAAELGFRIDPATRKAVIKNAPLLKRPAAERVREELMRIFTVECSSVWVRELEKTGLLDVIIPEIVEMKKSARRFYYHPLGLWQHAIETLIGLEDILSHLGKIFPDDAGRIERHLDEVLSWGVKRKSLLRLVSLLHDIAKPKCARRVGKRMRFLGHETAGADMAAEVLRRLRLSNKEIKIARRLVEYHMRPISLSQASVITPRAAFRLFRDLGNDLVDLLLLSLADCYSYRRLKTKITVNLKKQRCTVNALVARYYEEKQKPERPRLLDGNALMKEFGLSPGPLIGELLKIVSEAQGAGDVATTAEALTLVRHRLTPLKKRYKIT